MQATDRILLLNHYNLLMKDERNQPLWKNKKILIIQDAALFFDQDLAANSGELSSLFYNESYRMLLINIDARLVTEANAKAINMDMSIVPEVPESDDAVIQLIDHKEKSIKLISCKSEPEADTLIAAFKAGRIWSRYFIFCTKSQIKPNSKYLDWLVESINNPQYIPLTLESLDVFGEDYIEEITESVLEFLKANSLVRNIILKNFDSDELESRILFQILTSVTGHQIKDLSLIYSNIDFEALKILNPGLSHHSHLMRLDLSNNNINDNGLAELASIFPSITALNELNLSHNILQGKPEKIEEFLTAAQLNLDEIKLNLSENLLEDQCINIIEITVFHAEDIRITHLDISFNRFSNEGVYKISEAYRIGPNKGKFKLILLPKPFHQNFLMSYFQEKKTNLNLTLQRISFEKEEKKPPSSKQCIAEIKKIVKNIRTIRGQYLTIERLATVCHEIHELEYEFPNKKLDELRDIVWDLVNRAIEIEDFYSVTILQASAQKIGLDLFSLSSSLKGIKNKVRSIAKRMTRVINFDFPEGELNKELDDVIIDIYKHDIRGGLVDTLFSIKEKRDEFIRKMVQSNYKEDVEDEEIGIENKHDPFWLLENDLEYSKINASYIDDLSIFEENLYIHPKNINYFELSKLTQEKIEKNLNIYKEKFSNKDGNYYHLNICNRSLFLLADHVFKFYLNVWKFAKGDLLLNCSRIPIQYFNFSKRKELSTVLDPRPQKPSQLTYFKQNYQTPDNLYSFQIDFDMLKYLHLKPLENDKSESFHKTNTNPVENINKQHRGGLALADFNPATVKAGGILAELSNEKPKEKEKLGFQKTILDYAPGGLTGSLRKSKNPGFNQDAIALYQKIQLILDYDSESREEKCFRLIQELLQNLANSRNNYDLDREPDVLIDECYLQLYRFCNRSKEPKLGNFNQKLVFKLLSILTLYQPPSLDLQEHIRAWLFSKISDLSLENFIKKSLMNLMNHEIPEFIKPNWIPSLIEIKERLRNEREIQIPFRFCDENSHGYITIHEFETVEVIMNKIYDSNYLKSFEDKYAFWLYKGNNSKEEDIALLNNEIVLEVLGYCDETDCYLLLQRRVICSCFPLNYSKLDQIHLDSFFYQTKRNHIIKDKFSDFCKTETIARLAAILYIIELAMKNKKIVAKSEKVQKKLKTLIPESWLSKLTIPQLLQKIIPFLQLTGLTTMDVWSLKQEFINNLKSYYLLAGALYDCQIQDNVSGKNARVDTSININLFGIFFFKTRDKPIRSIFYEEIVYVVGNEYECSLFYIEKGTFQETRLNIFCRHQRARELNEDIVSYCILRTKEKPRLLYGLSSLPEFKAKFTGKAASVRIKKRNEEEEEEEDEIFEEKKRTNEIEQEISNNELVFLIDKCFAFHYDFPYFFGVQPPETRNPIPRSQKTVLEPRFSQKKEFINQNEAQSIIEGLRKPNNNSTSEEETAKEIKGILKKPGEDLLQSSREKKKTIIKENNELEPPPKLISPTNSSNPLKEDTIKPPPPPPKPLSLATVAKIKMAFKPPPPPPRKNEEKSENINKAEENEKKKEEKNENSSSDSENDYSDDIKMKPKFVDLKPIPINKLNKAIKLPPPPPRKAPIQENKPKTTTQGENSNYNSNNEKNSSEKNNETSDKSEKNIIETGKNIENNANKINDDVKKGLKIVKPLNINVIESRESLSENEKKEGALKKDNEIASNADSMNVSKNDTTKHITPKAQDLKKLDLKAILKPPIIKKSESQKKTSISLEKDGATDMKSSTKTPPFNNKLEEKIEKNEKSNENIENKEEKNVNNNNNEKKDALPQSKLNFSLANALKKFPKAPMKATKTPLTDEEKFFQLDNEEEKSPKKYESIKNRENNAKEIEPLVPFQQNIKKNSIENKLTLDSKEKANDLPAYKSQSDENDTKGQGIGEESSPKFERKLVRKKTQKSTSSENSASDKEKNLPDFIKRSDNEENVEKKDSSPKNKGPQSLSDKLKMRANKFKKR